MKVMRGYLRPAVAVLVLAVAFTVSVSHTGQASTVTGPTVLVANSGAGQAVPVSFPNTPTVNIGNTPTVNLGAGTSVGISGPLQISGPLTVKEQGTPFATMLCRDTNPAFCGALPSSFTTTGSLIIEYASTSCLLQGNTGGLQLNSVGLQVTTSGNGGLVHSIASIPSQIQVGVEQTINASFAQPTRIYADSASNVSFNVNALTLADSDARCFVAISGRLVTP